MTRALVTVLLFSSLFAVPARADQIEDSTFVPKVANPAFTAKHPVVMIDQAHHNYFSMRQHYRAFVSLLAKDGARVIPGVQRFSPTLLATCQVLVVADAMGGDNFANVSAHALAFQASECSALQDWVRAGGGLLLISEYAPFCDAMRDLIGGFGVTMSFGMTVDPHRMDPETGSPGCILFSRAQGSIADHPITRGRDKSERIERVATFTGQSLLGPPGSHGLLVLGPSAADYPPSAGAPQRKIDPEARRLSQLTDDMKAAGLLPAVGRFQAVAFTLGKGRVVVLGEGAMFAAQKVVGPDAQLLGKQEVRMGLNRPDLDNAQFALNILHWLARIL
ncbi:MAG TPA: DUF4350 domain-containing protein [Terriglobales bacterium]|nr:DUF4350 domain-containing protein [Terriglobales bacterium]